jgi:GDPmannose 4,6-dehydratase
MSKIALITGITGQDGSYLADLLISKNYEVHGLVRNDFDLNNDSKTWRIKKNLNNIAFHKESIENYDGILKILKNINPNEIYHLAAQAKDGHSFKDEFYTFRINLNATHYLLSASKEINKKLKFFCAGSSETYGDVNHKPLNEMSPFKPRSAYGISKLACYHLVQSYREIYNIHASTGIFFNHESPRKDINFVGRKISSSVAKIKNGMQKEIILGDINAKRDWGHAKDYVEAAWLMTQKKTADDFVLGSGELHSVEEFAKKAFEYVNLNYKDYLKIDKNLIRNRDSVARLADITKAKKILKWKPYFNFNNMVHDMVESDLKNLKKT